MSQNTLSSMALFPNSIDAEHRILFKPDIAARLSWVAAEKNQPIPCNDGAVAMYHIPPES